MTEKTQPEMELLLNGEPYRAIEDAAESGVPGSLEEESAHLCPHDRDVLCPAEVCSRAISERVRRDLQLHPERHRQLAQDRSTRLPSKRRSSIRPRLAPLAAINQARGFVANSINTFAAR